MDAKVNSQDLFFENESLRKELDNVTQAKNDLLRIAKAPPCKPKPRQPLSYRW
jgi:hypothetical protein